MTPTPYEVRYTDSLALGVWQQASGLTGKTAEVGYGVEQEVAMQVQRSIAWCLYRVALTEE